MQRLRPRQRNPADLALDPDKHFPAHLRPLIPERALTAIV
jgi:hypothetical protein